MVINKKNFHFLRRKLLLLLFTLEKYLSYDFKLIIKPIISNIYPIMMVMSSVVSILILLTISKGTNALKDVKLKINPAEVRRGEQATLLCLYDLEGDSLMSVKWYRGQREFYRITPNEEPTAKIFPYNGINVDESRSNASQVVLQQVGFSLSGNISCEVTVENNFKTSLASMQMTVVELPDKRPTITTEKGKYKINDTLIAECLTSPSNPAASLSFLLNNIPVGSPDTKAIPLDSSSSQYISKLTLNITLQPKHFNKHGQLLLKCTALVASHRKTAELYVPPNTNEPIPERVRSYGSSAGIVRVNDGYRLAVFCVVPLVFYAY